MTKKKKGKKGKGKGKKEGKLESKVDKELDVEKAKANAALWEARLDVTEHSRLQYREAARKLAQANEELTNQQYRAEKDTVDIIALLKKKDAQKEEKIKKMEEQLKLQKAQALTDKEEVVAEYTRQITELEDKFKKRSNEFKMIQGELKTIKEFRKKKAQMEHELNSIKESMSVTNKEHKDSIARIEHKFFSEKLRLEKEAELRIAQLAERAHNEAIVQLDDASRSVFKENVRLNEALSYHMKEEENLRKISKSLAEENATLVLYKESAKAAVQEGVSRLKTQKEQVLQLQEKVASLEQALGIMAMEFERDKEEARQRAMVSSQASQVELDKLQKVLAMREKEMSRVKRMAHSVVEQRTDMENFFQDALRQVKLEIQSNRLQYRQEALEAYRHRMSEARAGRREYPRVRTFHKTPCSTNSVYSDMEEAEKWAQGQSSGVDMSELTWEQKEKVLRLLFAKMNGLKIRKPIPPLALQEPSSLSTAAAPLPPPPPPPPLPPLSVGNTEVTPHVTFITQTALPDLPSDPAGHRGNTQTT